MKYGELRQITNNKYEIPEQLEFLFGKSARNLYFYIYFYRYNIIIFLYMSIALWNYAAVFGTSAASLIAEAEPGNATCVTIECIIN